jgi:hypothetical protein
MELIDVGAQAVLVLVGELELLRLLEGQRRVTDALLT